jgi:hypothetical protein
MEQPASSTPVTVVLTVKLAGMTVLGLSQVKPELEKISTVARPGPPVGPPLRLSSGRASRPIGLGVARVTPARARALRRMNCCEVVSGCVGKLLGWRRDEPF